MKTSTIFIFILLLQSSLLYSQVAVNNDGNDPNSSAMLDVSSTTRGMLVPRMTVEERDLIANPAAGLLIFCTTDNHFYFNRGTPEAPEWTTLKSQWESNGDNIYYNNGNVGIGITNPWARLDIRGGTEEDGVIFNVGNSDLSHRLSFYSGKLNDPNPWIIWNPWDSLRFATYHATTGWSEKMRITGDGKVGIGIAAPVLPLDVKDSLGINGSRLLYFPDQGNFTGSLFVGNGGGKLVHDNPNQGKWNTAVGIGALKNDSTGYGNTAIGWNALYSNLSGGYNTAIGHIALYSSISGQYNTAIGYRSLYHNTGGYNTAIGVESLWYNTTGVGNTGIGYYANHSNRTGSNNTIIGYLAGGTGTTHNKTGNIFIGYRAGYNETGSNKLYIENSLSETPLIGGDFEANEVYLNGSVGIGTDSPDSTALLEMSSTSKGFLPPRMTSAEMASITNPAIGLMIFNLDINKPAFFDGSYWIGFDGQPLCGVPFIDSRDGQSYNTVQLSTQCWMAENLNVGTMIDSLQNMQDNGTLEKYCYHNEEDSCAKYGGLYQWDEMMQYTTTPGEQGICPEGWHAPTDAEWTTLTDYVSSIPDYWCNSNSVYIAKALADSTNWASSTSTCDVGNNLNENNATGFSGLPGGYRNYVYGGFFSAGLDGLWWSSTEGYSYSAWYRFLNYDYQGVSRNDFEKEDGFSVRCLRD